MALRRRSGGGANGERFDGTGMVGKLEFFDRGGIPATTTAPSLSSVDDVVVSGIISLCALCIVLDFDVDGVTGDRISPASPSVLPAVAPPSPTSGAPAI
jgi:hypothetical protein